jgi:hypothetical protein
MATAMKFVLRLALVLCAALVGPYLIKYFIFGTADFLPSNERMGEWKKAKIREACFSATEAPHRDPLLSKRPTQEHHIGWRDINRAIEMTAALNCYLVTHPDAICEPNNRAYIVDYIGRYLAKSNEMLDSAKRYGESEVQIVRTLWDSQRNRAINAALTSNINSGRLIKADFGWFPPSELKAKLEQYRGTTDNCPKS